MTFRDYINSLPNLKEKELKKIAEVTCSHITTVYRWMNGTVDPPKVKQKIIADVTGLPIEDLFPHKERNN
ncbi:MAG: XRE family transcriptional regulator [Tannerellaceae bacterium]|jgi:hypothetical protein|nr:XRE family transcriptional regulator [Tannerellaceae bacterium]